MLRLLEFEIEDVRRLLADVPVAVEEEDCSESEDCPDCGAAVSVDFTRRSEVVDTDAAHRQYVADLVERIGAIYDVARARAIRESVDN